MYTKPNKAYASTGIEQPFSKSKNVQGVFFAVAEKGGMKWNGASNFHDALKQSDYLNHINKVVDIPDGKSTKVAVKEGWNLYSKEFLKKPVPLKGKPGVGVIELSLGAFMFSYGLTRTVIGIFENAIQNHENVKTLETITSRGAIFESLGDVYTVRVMPRTTGSSIMENRVFRYGVSQGILLNWGYGYMQGTPNTYGFQLLYTPSSDPWGNDTSYYRVYGSWTSISPDTGREHVGEVQLDPLEISEVEAITGGHVATITPTDMGLSLIHI